MVMKMRSVFILLLIVAYAGPYLSQGYVYTSRYGAVLNAWGTFACAMSNAKILLVCFVGYILLISDVPYFSAANIYEVVRSKRWTIMPVRVIALLKVTLLYFAVLFLLSWAVSRGASPASGRTAAVMLLCAAAGAIGGILS